MATATIEPNAALTTDYILGLARVKGSVKARVRLKVAVSRASREVELVVKMELKDGLVRFANGCDKWRRVQRRNEVTKRSVLSNASRPPAGREAARPILQFHSRQLPPSDRHFQSHPSRRCSTSPTAPSREGDGAHSPCDSLTRSDSATQKPLKTAALN